VLVGETPLMLAARLGHEDVLRVLLTTDPPVEMNWRDANGCTALYHAAGNNQLMAVKLLLAHGACSDISTNDGATPLMLAVRNGNLEMVEEFLLARSPTLLNAHTQDGWSALHIAVRGDYLRIADALISNGADPNSTVHNSGATPLMMALSAEMTVLLLERGADASASDEYGCNSLMTAASEGRVDIMKLLLAADPTVDVNQQTDKGQTALSIAVMHFHLPAVELLLYSGGNPRIADNTGSLPLLFCRTPQLVMVLIDAAPDMVNHTCNKGRRALAYLTFLDLLKELFASCARHDIQIDVNHADANGDTALHMAMLLRSGPEAVQLLLGKGADVFGVGYGDTTALMKPFLHVDEDVVAREYDLIQIADMSPEQEEEELADATISACLRTLLDHVLDRPHRYQYGCRHRYQHRSNSYPG
jgi:ankyrin repeat protein